MPQADIEINSTAASDEDLPINTLVQMSNNDIGDESTYLWEIVDQPAGAADALSSTVIENPTLTPTKEGTYLLQLTVDQALSTEAVDRKLFRIRSLKTRAGFLAAEETTEADSDEGWKARQNVNLGIYDARIFDGMIVVGVAGSALAQGDVVKVTGVSTIKSGLPGEEDLPTWDDSLATSTEVLRLPQGVVISRPDGNAAIAIGELVLVRIVGLFTEATFAGSPAIGDDVFVDDTGQVALATGTNTRVIGQVAALPTGATYTVFFNGLDT